MGQTTFVITVFIGDTSDELAKTAQALDSTAKLITPGNYLNLQAGTYYTSMGSLNNLKQFTKILQQADRIIYAPPAEWNDPDSKIGTEKYLQSLVVNNKRTVEGFTPTPPLDLEEMLQLAGNRSSDGPQIWCVGCSISKGNGIDPEQRYGQLVANELGLPISFLTVSGTGIQWAADQILRSDIRPGDIVIWGLSSHLRLNYFTDHVRHVFGVGVEVFTAIIPNKGNTVKSSTTTDSNNNAKIRLEDLDSPNNLYHQLVDIFKVINFCNKIGAKLILANLLGQAFTVYLEDRPELVNLYGMIGIDSLEIFTDFGSDNVHPGPKMHRYYADEILKRLT